MEITSDLLYYQARVAERIQRPYDIIKFMDQLIIQKPVLSSKERDLFFSGYKKIIDSLRYTIQTFEDYLMQSGTLTLNDDGNPCSSTEEDQLYRNQLKNSIKKYTNELIAVCKKAIETIDNILLIEANESESCIFYHKTRADYFRYIAEFQEGAEKDDVIKNSELSYQTALRLAQSNKHLKKSDPLYLGLALNYSVCEYEYMNKKKEIIEFSDAVFKEAVKTLDELDEEKYNESTLLMQLLRDNITNWSNED